MSEPENKTGQPKAYELNGVSILVYLLENGEFGWTPTTQACGDKESAKRFLAVLKKMPRDKREVWAKRLDIEQTITTCPLVNNDADVSKDFAQFCDTHSNTDQRAHKKNELENIKNHNGGES